MNFLNLYESDCHSIFCLNLISKKKKESNFCLNVGKNQGGAIMQLNCSKNFKHNNQYQNNT